MKRTLLCCAVLTSAFASICEGEFQVNTHTTYDQKDASIAMDAQGNFTVVWNSYKQDGDSGGIFGRRFDPNGEPLGGEFQINSTTPGNQTEPAVAMDAVGNFVVAWQGPGVSEEDIFARRFDPNGEAFGAEFGVNSDTEGRQRFARVAMNAAGAFAIVWESEKVVGESSVRGICCRLYDANGLSIGGEFEVNLEPDCRYPDVAMAGSGNFAVAWMRDRSSNSIMARLYNADGTAGTEPFEVSTIGFSSITRPAIAMSDSGHFVVAWDGDPELASLDDIHARLYEPNGTAMVEQFVVNTALAGAQQNPRVAMNSELKFVIVWDSRTDPNINERDIFGRRYTGFAQPMGREFQINTYVMDDQRCPAVAIGEDGSFAAVWESDEQDGSRYGIFGQTMPGVGCADFDGDGLVNFEDYSILAQEWRENEKPLTADLTDDNRIDVQDLAAFFRQWIMP